MLALDGRGPGQPGDTPVRLWREPKKTVETHIRGAFAKLGIKEAPEDVLRISTTRKARPLADVLGCCLYRVRRQDHSWFRSM